MNAKEIAAALDTLARQQATRERALQRVAALARALAEHAEALLEDRAPARGAKRRRKGRRTNFTPAERRKIRELLAAGESRAAIARKMKCAPQSVDYYREGSASGPKARGVKKK